MTTPTFTCTWCQTSAHPQSAMQPSFCTECVHATLHGTGETRKAPDATPPAGPALSSQPLNSPGAPEASDAGRRDDPKEIRYSRADRDYTATFDGMYIGSFPSHLAAETALNDYALGLLEDGLIDEVPAAIYARPAEVVEFVPAVISDAGDFLEDGEGCPGCGIAIGIPLTATCTHPLGCGFWRARGARWYGDDAPICDNCAAPATTTIDLIQLCDACERAAQTRLLRATFGHVCLSCGDPVVQEGLCEACQEAGEPWPVVQAIQDGHAASGLIPVLALHAWATTDRPAFRAALAGLSAAQLEWQAAIYAAYLTMQTERTVTTEATLTHFRRSVAIHWSCATPTAKETTMNHTPGPWTYEPKARMKHDLSAPIKGPDGLYVATALDMNRYDRDEEVEANAHLIAAAPDLLAACEAAFDYWQATGFANCEPGCTCIVDLMRVAIAKARQDKAPV